MTGKQRQRTGGAFVRDVAEAVRLVDVACILAVPLVILAVFALPLEVRRAYVFSYTEPTVLTAFTAAYVHLEPGHLLTNLGVYALVVPAVYLLSVLGGTRRRFLAAFVTFVVVFPAVLSVLNLAFARPAVGYGFSGVVMAFFGFLPIALSGHLRRRFDLTSELDLAGGLFFAGLALVAILSPASLVTYGLAAAAGLAALLYGLPMLDGRTGLVRNVRAASGAAGHFELSVGALVAFLAFPFVAFPTAPGSGGAIVNVYVHLLGYALGFMATYVTVQAVRAIDGRRDRTRVVDGPTNSRPGDVGRRRDHSSSQGADDLPSSTIANDSVSR